MEHKHPITRLRIVNVPRNTVMLWHVNYSNESSVCVWKTPATADSWCLMAIGSMLLERTQQRIVARNVLVLRRRWGHPASPRGWSQYTSATEQRHRLTELCLTESILSPSKSILIAEGQRPETTTQQLSVRFGNWLAAHTPSLNRSFISSVHILFDRLYLFGESLPCTRPRKMHKDCLPLPHGHKKRVKPGTWYSAA